MFRKSPNDLIKGYRNARGAAQESQFVSKCVGEIREEIKSPEQHIKADALLKLSYLNLVAGIEMSWASFAVVEVMSFPRFAHKRIGYSAATQSFNEDTEVLMLLPNLLRKDLGSSNAYESGLAVTCLANICTPDLARDVVSDVAAMLNSSRAYTRKKAVLLMYRIFLQFPEALRPSFPRLREKLEDPDPSVVSAAVNVMCELARKNPKNYLSLAPVMFRILTTSSNNWMLIRVLKFLQSLVPHEPRLSKKLVDPLTNLISSTPAKSLLYECIETAIAGCATHMPLVRLCLEKLKTFVEDADPNLKYLGLLGLRRVMDAHPKTVAEYKDLVLQCLDDEDVTIRRRALDLVSGMVSKRTVVDIVAKIMSHIATAEGSYRGDLVAKVVGICSNENYAVVPSFQWYITVLVELAKVKGAGQGELIAGQLLDVIVRVRAIRKFGVGAMCALLMDKDLVSAGSNDSSTETLYAAAWAVGEYPDDVPNPALVVEALLQPRAASLPANIQAVYMQNALKLWIHCAARAAGGALPDSAAASAASLLPTSDGTTTSTSTSSPGAKSTGGKQEITTADLLGQLDPMGPGASTTEGETQQQPAGDASDPVAMMAAAANSGPVDPAHAESHALVTETINARLPLFTRSVHVEVQERATFLGQVMALYAKERLSSGHDIAMELASIFKEELHPVAPKAQRKVPIPAGLDLDAVINEIPETESEDEDRGNDHLVSGFRFGDDMGGDTHSARSSYEEPTQEDLERRAREREARDQARIHDPYYLGSGTSSGRTGGLGEGVDVDDIPIVKLSSEDVGGAGLNLDVGAGGRRGRHGRSGRRGRGGRHGGIEPEENAVVSTTFAMPEGAVSSDEDAGPTSKGLEDIDLSKPLGADETLPTAETYEQKRMSVSASKPTAAAQKAAADAGADGGKSRKSGKHRSHHKSDAAGGSGKHRKHRSSKREGGSSSAAAQGGSNAGGGGGSLIDFDPLSTSGSGAGKLTSVSQVVGHEVSFDRIDSPTVSATADQFDVLGLGGAAPSPINTNADTSDANAGRRHRRHKGGDSKAGGGGGGESGKRSSRHHRHHRSDKEKSVQPAVQPVQASYPDLVGLLSNPQHTFHAATLALPNATLDTSLAACGKAGLALVQRMDTGAALYGRTPDGKGHACAIVKALPQGGVSIEVKATGADLAAAVGGSISQA